jgi:hypothetical protein
VFRPPFANTLLEFSGNQPLSKMLARKRKWRREALDSERDGPRDSAARRLPRAAPKGMSRVLHLLSCFTCESPLALIS